MHRMYRRAAALATGLLIAGATAACGGGAGGSASNDDKIVVGSILDVSGIQNVSGQAMHNSIKLAIKQWNADGGLLGKQVELKFYDAQSDQAKYSQYANQLALKDKPDVAMAGINSASREAIRPIFDRTKTLYFYNELYEGGVCDKNTFATGVVPSQSLAALIPEEIEKYGPRVYVVGADYNFGQISGQWARKYVEDAGGEIVGEDYVPLESSNFSSVIDDLQRIKPDIVVSFLVGTNHTAFYRAYSAAGLNDQMRIASTVFGLSSEQNVLSADEARNIDVAYGYMPALDTPANAEFRKAYEDEYGAKALASMTDSAITIWNGMHLWAAAVEKAGTTDRDKVIEALESGDISFDSPSGTVTVDPGTHHVIQPVSIGETDGKGGFKVLTTKDAVEPTYEQSVCDLVADPDTNEQFTP